jgi:hypothetical protein
MNSGKWAKVIGKHIGYDWQASASKAQAIAIGIEQKLGYLRLRAINGAL